MIIQVPLEKCELYGKPDEIIVIVVFIMVLFTPMVFRWGLMSDGVEVIFIEQRSSDRLISTYDFSN